MFKKRKKTISPLPRGFYAFNVGRAGDFILFVESTSDFHKFLYLPGADPFFLTHEDFSNSIDNNSLAFVEQLPEEIYNESLSLSCPNQQTRISMT